MGFHLQYFQFSSISYFSTWSVLIDLFLLVYNLLFEHL